jgi:hypothetical protein
MHRILSICIVATLAGGGLCACGGGSGGGNNPGGGVQPLVSDIGTTGVFAAWVDPIGGGYAYAPMGSYAGKKQTLRGTIDFLSGAELNQAAGVEIYKGSDGHIYALDLTSRFRQSTPPRSMTRARCQGRRWRAPTTTTRASTTWRTCRRL